MPGIGFYYPDRSLQPGVSSGAPQAATCGFEFGPIYVIGAGGAEVFNVAITPLTKSEHCTTNATVTTSIVTADGTPIAGISDSPFTATVPLTFSPNLLDPVIFTDLDGECTPTSQAYAIRFQSGTDSATYGLGFSYSCQKVNGMPGSQLFPAYGLYHDDDSVGLVPTPDHGGYWIGNQANVSLHGDAPNFSAQPAAIAVGIAGTKTVDGYWLVAADGGVFAYGNAGFYGSAGNFNLNSPIVGMAATPDGNGYWLVAADGGVFAYGNAGFYGSAGNINLNSPIVGMAATPDGNGYWLVAADGGVFTYGDAGFYGSAGNINLNSPIVGMAATPDGNGYWLVAADGGVFAYGDAGFYGSAANIDLAAPIAGITATPDGAGYWLVGADGGVFAYGDAYLD